MKTLKWLTLLFIPGMLTLPGYKPGIEPGQTQAEYLFAKKSTYRVSLPNAKLLPTVIDIVFKGDTVVFVKVDQLKRVLHFGNLGIKDPSAVYSIGRRLPPPPPPPCRAKQCYPRDIMARLNLNGKLEVKVPEMKVVILYNIISGLDAVRTDLSNPTPGKFVAE